MQGLLVDLNATESKNLKKGHLRIQGEIGNSKTIDSIFVPFRLNGDIVLFNEASFFYGTPQQLENNYAHGIPKALDLGKFALKHNQGPYSPFLNIPVSSMHLNGTLSAFNSFLEERLYEIERAAKHMALHKTHRIPLYYPECFRREVVARGHYYHSQIKRP